MIRIEIWGTALFSDSLAKSVRDEYNAIIGVGLSFADAEELVIKGFCEYDRFLPEHESVFWLALAYTEHKYGALSEKVKERALYAIDSGEDIKKWENAAAYEPYYRYISAFSADDKRFEMLKESAERKYGEIPADPVDKSFHDFQVEMIKKLVEEYPKYEKMLPSSMGGKKTKIPKPVPKPDIPEDAFFSQIVGLNGTCAKNLEKRKEILRETREYLTTPQPPKKVRKESGRHCPWEAGDVVAVKTHGAGKNIADERAADLYEKEHGVRPVNCFYEDGKYILLIILKVERKPVSDFVPAHIVSNDNAIVGFYDYYGDKIPDKSELLDIPFLKWDGLFSTVDTAMRVGFYGSARFLKKTEWTVIEHYDGFPNDIPEFFKEGVMGSLFDNFGHGIFNHIQFIRRKKLKIILASNNKNKLKEMREILAPYGFKVVSQAEAGADIEVEETGTTFEENSALKAAAIFDMLHTPVIADDSGLTVDYLNGAPGIYSARYAEEGKRCDRVLSELEGVPDEKRTAAFVCVICYIDENGEKHFFRGECKGKIGHEKRGTNGFGYDPIFYVGDKSFAEISSDEKNSMSHRGNALKKLEEFLGASKRDMI